MTEDIKRAISALVVFKEALKNPPTTGIQDGPL
jgi:hypothetical protein